MFLTLKKKIFLFNKKWDFVFWNFSSWVQLFVQSLFNILWCLASLHLVIWLDIWGADRICVDSNNCQHKIISPVKTPLSHTTCYFCGFERISVILTFVCSWEGNKKITQLAYNTHLFLIWCLEKFQKLEKLADISQRRLKFEWEFVLKATGGTFPS